jgi:quinol monooxygenase YgiN
MSITVNITYTGKDGNARKFAQEMMEKGIVERIRQEQGNEVYAYFYPVDDEESVLLIDKWENQEAIDFHHKTDMMKEIADLRTKYGLRMKVQRFTELP